MKPSALLVISKEAWGDIRWARKQWLPYYLAESMSPVVYLDRHAAWWRGETAHAAYRAGSIEVLQHRLLLPFERMPAVRSLNRRLIASHLAPMQDDRHRWFCLYYHPYDLPLVQRLSGRSTIIFDWTEDWAIFHDDDDIGAMQRAAVMEADIVLTVTERLRDRAVAWRGGDKGVFHIPNATALERPAGEMPMPESFEAIGKPRITFVGHAGPWFDESLMSRLVEKYPACQWIMIGGRGDAVRAALDDSPNVHWLGPMRPDQLLPYMHHSDLLIAPYRAGIEGDATKLYDYLVAGRPILSTPCETAERLQPWVRMCADLPAWQAAIDHYLAGNIPSEQQDGVAQHHHWRNRAADVLRCIQEYGRA